MFVEIKRIRSKFSRLSKLGRSHTYCRYKTVATLLCDACHNEFQRELGKTNKKRLSQQYQHVCETCNQKSFAQQIGVQHRRFWNISVDADLDISKS